MTLKGRYLSAAFLALISILIGCSGIGPRFLTRDRFDYTAAISDSWKDQMLLNMVKIRYADAPVFLWSRRLFSSLMFVITLMETEDKGGTPIVTIPAGGG